MINRTELKQMLSSNKLDFAQLEEFKNHLENLSQSNVIGFMPRNLDKKVKEGHNKCIPLLDKALNSDNDNDSRQHLQNVVNILDECWEYTFQQALIHLSEEKMEKVYETATKAVKDIVDNNSEDNSQKHPSNWAEIVVMINALNGR